MTLKIIGKKKGMTRLFDENGNHVVCTVIAAEPNLVTQIKRKDTHGYEAVQLSAFKARSRKNISRALRGHFAKAGIEPNVYLIESRVEDVDSFHVAQPIGVGYFSDAAYVDV